MKQLCDKMDQHLMSYHTHTNSCTLTHTHILTHSLSHTHTLHTVCFLCPPLHCRHITVVCVEKCRERERDMKGVMSVFMDHIPSEVTDPHTRTHTHTECVVSVPPASAVSWTHSYLPLLTHTHTHTGIVYRICCYRI